MKKIDKKSRIPLYTQLIDIIIEDIENGRIQPNEKLPSERDLCEMFDVSRITVRQTLQELERDGYIYKEHGKGSYVSPQTYTQSLVKFYSFTEEMKKMNKAPSTQVLDFEIIECGEKLAGYMKLQTYDEVYKITRLRLADGEPLIYETSYLPVNRFQNLTKEELIQTPMYDIFKYKYQVQITNGTETFVAVKTKTEEAKWLKINKDIPSMLIKRLTFENDHVIEYTTSIARGDKFFYTVELQ
ncbi:GntR family transcriptional regulator [Heyndrickxia sporothermodurans]|nr:GntR family transcriptional regulator [Heyndrickxia sporothermodurans]